MNPTRWMLQLRTPTGVPLSSAAVLAALALACTGLQCRRRWLTRLNRNRNGPDSSPGRTSQTRRWHGSVQQPGGLARTSR
jgi:hypothetical protein